MKTKHYFMLAAIVAVIALAAFITPGSQLANTSSASVKNTIQVDQKQSLDMPQSVRDLVDKELVKPLRKKHYGTDKPNGREFSRCPSGIHAYFEDDAVSAKDGYFHGAVNKYSGCDSNELCKFRANTTGVQIETKDNGYMSASEWLNRAIAKQGVKEI